MVLAEVVPLRIGMARIDEWIEVYAGVLGLEQPKDFTARIVATIKGITCKVYFFM